MSIDSCRQSLDNAPIVQQQGVCDSSYLIILCAALFPAACAAGSVDEKSFIMVNWEFQFLNLKFS